jgi:hypothetical protein
MLPVFDINGNLPIGIHMCSLDEFKQKLVTDFVNSSTRNTIYLGYVSYCNEFLPYEVVYSNLTTGSFVSNKQDPHDIDLIVYVDAQKHKSMKDLDKFNVRFNNREQIHIDYNCHTFVIPFYPKSHPLYVVTAFEEQRWIKFFSKDRKNNSRGFAKLEAYLDGFRSAIEKEVGN